MSFDIIPGSQYKGQNGSSDHYPHRRHHGIRCSKHLYGATYLTEVWVGFVSGDTFVFTTDSTGPDFVLNGQRSDEDVWEATLAWIDGVQRGYRLGEEAHKKLVQEKAKDLAQVLGLLWQK